MKYLNRKILIMSLGLALFPLILFAAVELSRDFSCDTSSKKRLNCWDTFTPKFMEKFHPYSELAIEWYVFDGIVQYEALGRIPVEFRRKYHKVFWFVGPTVLVFIWTLVIYGLSYGSIVCYRVLHRGPGKPGPH